MALKKTVKEVVEKVKKALATEEVKETPVVNKQAPGFDPDIPEQKQRWLR